MSHFNKESSSKLPYSPTVYLTVVAVCFVSWGYVVAQFAITLIKLLAIPSSGPRFVEMLIELLPLLVVATIAIVSTYLFNHQSDARRLVVDGKKTVAGLLGNDASRDVWLSSFRLARLERLEGCFRLTLSERGSFSEDFVIYDRLIIASFDDAFTSENMYTVIEVFDDLKETLKVERSSRKD